MNIIRQYMQRKRSTKVFLIGMLVVLLGATVFLFQKEEIFAATEAELQQQIENTNARIEQLRREIRDLGSNILETSQERLTLEAELKRIEQTRQTLLKELELTSSEIEQTSLNIETLNKEISDKERRINEQKRAIEQTLRHMHAFDGRTPFELLLSEREISDYWNEIDQLQTLQDASRRHIRELQGLKVELRGDVFQKETRKEELEELKDEIESQKKLVEQNREEQSELVTQTKNKEEVFKQQLLAKQAQIEAFEAELEEYESRLQFLANPSALPPKGSGVLSWPLDTMLVTQQFGAKTGPHRTYVHGHSGTDFRAQTPQKLYAMADGVVMGTGNTDLACRGVSFGKWITIKHDNGLVSTSAHLSLIQVNSGERVKRGQIIGYTGNTGRSTAPHLHISLYAGVDANGNNPVEVLGAPSLACSGKTLVQPRASREAYLDVMDYLANKEAIQYKAGVPAN